VGYFLFGSRANKLGDEFCRLLSIKIRLALSRGIHIIDRAMVVVHGHLILI